MAEGSFVCAFCGRTIKSSWTDEEALVHFQMMFGKKPDKPVKLCPPCFGWVYDPRTMKVREITRGIMPDWTIEGRTIEDVVREIHVRLAKVD